MAELGGLPIKDEQPRFPAPRRVLRDKFFRQFEIKRGDIHGPTSASHLGLCLAAHGSDCNGRHTEVTATVAG